MESLKRYGTIKTFLLVRKEKKHIRCAEEKIRNVVEYINEFSRNTRYTRVYRTNINTSCMNIYLPEPKPVTLIAR